MSHSLDTLIEKSRNVRMSRQQAEEQRQSFAYGSANIENSLVTRETVKAAAAELESRSTRMISMSERTVVGNQAG